jgi:hypothetical protein
MLLKTGHDCQTIGCNRHAARQIHSYADKEQESPANSNILLTSPESNPDNAIKADHTIYLSTDTTTSAKSAGTGAYLGGRYSMENIVAFGSIPERTKEVWSSKRIRFQPNSNTPQMERAQLLTRAKNEGYGSGISEHPRNSIRHMGAYASATGRNILKC